MCSMPSSVQDLRDGKIYARKAETMRAKNALILFPYMSCFTAISRSVDEGRMADASV